MVSIARLFRRSPAAAASAAAAPAGNKKHDAKALRDAAYDAHKPVRSGEGFKEKIDVTPGTEAQYQASFAQWGRFEASKMIVVPERGGPPLRVVAYEYHSGKPMEAWLDHKPKDGKLKLRAVVCVSGHHNLPHDKFARENKYTVEVRGPTGRQTLKPFGPGVSKKPEHASVSPLFEIDVSKPGDYVIDCYPLQSAGTGGYIEARRLILHVTGNEA